MDYVICPICGTLVSEQFKTCPYCGCSSEIIFRHTGKSQASQTNEFGLQPSGEASVCNDNKEEEPISVFDGNSQELKTSIEEEHESGLETSNYVFKSQGSTNNSSHNNKQAFDSPYKKNNKLIWVIIISTLLILIALGILISILSKKDKSSSSLGQSQSPSLQSSASKPSASQTNNYQVTNGANSSSELLWPVSAGGPFNPNNTNTNANYHVANMFDNNLQTAWVYRQDTRLSDIKLSVHLRESGVYIDRIVIYNGYQATEDSFYNSGRPSAITINANGRNIVNSYLKDTRSGQIISVGKEIKTSTSNITLEIVFNQKDLYPGTKYQNFAISEMLIFGHPLNSSQYVSYTNNNYDEEFESEGDDYLGIHSYIWEYKKMEESEASLYTKTELEIIRNSIFAHHGYRFKRKDLFDYFSQFAWYNPTTDDMAAVSKELSSVERYNVEFIQKQEKK